MPQYHFPTMQVGDSFAFRITDARDKYGKLIDLKRVRQAASAYKRRYAPDGWQYSIRKLSDTQGECRRVS